jgi:hypothetical protein
MKFYLKIVYSAALVYIFPLSAMTPDELIFYSEAKVGIISESSYSQNAQRLYTYYQAKLLNDLTLTELKESESTVWGLLGTGHNPENKRQTLLEWHADSLKKHNWGKVSEFQWIHATSQSDMVLGFLTSAYSSVCLGGTSVVEKADDLLAAIHRQSIFVLKNNILNVSCISQDEKYTARLAIQVGRNIYYRNLYRDNLALTEENAAFLKTKESKGTADILLATEENLQVAAAIDTPKLDQSFVSFVEQERKTKIMPYVLESIDVLSKIFLNPVSFESELTPGTLLEKEKHSVYMFALASMAVLDADCQQFDWVPSLKSYIKAIQPQNIFLEQAAAVNMDNVLNAAKNAVINNCYKTLSYFSYGYKNLPDPLNPAMETANGALLYDKIPFPSVVNRVTPVDLGFMYEKLREAGDYGLQYLKPIEGTNISRMIEQIHFDIGIVGKFFDIFTVNRVEHIQEGVTLTTPQTYNQAIYAELSPIRETASLYPIMLKSTPEYCQWRDIFHFHHEIIRVIAAPDLIHERANFGHTFDLTNQNFNFTNNNFLKKGEAQITQEEANAIMKGTWYKESLNFIVAYHYARSHNLLLNFYENALPTGKAENPCLPGKIRQVTNWHEVQLTKQKDYLLSAIRMLFPEPSSYAGIAYGSYEGIQFNTFLDFITQPLTHEFVIQKIETYAMENSIFIGGDLFGIDDFQKDDQGNYSLKKAHYPTVLARPEFEIDIAPIAFESYVQRLLFDKILEYFQELNAVNPDGTYRHPAAQKAFVANDSRYGIQAFHSGHIVLNEYTLPDLPSIIISGATIVNGVKCEYGLLGMYINELPKVIEAIKKNPYE